VIAAAGDIACDPTDANFNAGLGTASACRQRYTSDLLVGGDLAKVLPLGDLQYNDGTLDQILASYDPSWGRVKSISRPIFGNHESTTPYYDYFNGPGVANGPAGPRGKGFHSYDVGSWHLIALNSNCERVSCAAGGEQEQWLRSDLAAHPDGCRLAYWHHPRFSSGFEGDHTALQPLWQALFDARVDVALVGHSHDYERFAPMDANGNLDRSAGIRQFVVGTGGAFFTGFLATKPNSEVRQNNTYGVLRLTLGLTEYRWQFVPEAGKTFTDSGTGSCHRPNVQMPSASFDASRTAPLTNETVTFTSTSSSDPRTSIVRHEWDLDGSGSFETDTGSTATVSHAYASAGPVAVKLRVTDDVGNSDVAAKTLTVQAPPKASLSASPNPALTGQTVSFDASGSSDSDGSITSYEWDLDGDGSFEWGTGANPVAARNYATAVTVDARVRVTDDDGHTSIAARTLTIKNRPPLASFTAVPNPANAGEAVTFDASASNDPDGSIVKYQWDLDGNGSLETDTGTSPVASRSYTAGSSPTVRLRVTDDSGESAEITKALTVGGEVPSARFVLSANPVLTGEPVTFDASGSRDPDGSISRYEWDLDGNGTLETDTGRNPIVTRVYPTSGSVRVKLRVTDNSGTPAEATATLSVDDRPPVAFFTASPNPSIAGQRVDFDASSSSDPDGKIVKFEWDLNGNGSFETDTGAVAKTGRTYDTGRVITVTLRVTDDAGNSQTHALTVTVQGSAPTASFSASPSPALTGQLVTFTSTSTDPDGAIAKYEWDLDGDGEFDPVQTASQVSTSYSTARTVAVRLRVTDDQGSSAETTKLLSVKSAPLPAFSMSPSPALIGQTVTFDASSSTDPDGGTIAKYEWDLDGSGSYDKTGAKVSTSYSSAGTRNVKLRVTDNEGFRSDVTRALRVNSRRVEASFTYAPEAPLSGDVVDFRSTSSATGADNEIVGHRWDLDGNGTYETDSGPGTAASSSYASGRFTVMLEVKDRLGNIGLAARELAVADRLVPAPFESFPVAPLPSEPPAPMRSSVASPPKQAPSLIQPFPTVRLKGAPRARGIFVRRLTVQAPAGSAISVRCRGGRCPTEQLNRLATRSRPLSRKGLAVVRFRPFERRLLAVGAKIEVFITKPGSIGKYARFKVRKAKPPARVDGCLMPGAEHPAPCP
jgi:YD repeat-containing protein